MNTKICGKCKQEKPIGEFYPSKRDGYRSRCKDCQREENRIYNRTPKRRKYNAEIQKRQRRTPRENIKKLARLYTYYQMKAGKIARESCAVCGEQQGEAHHKDYNEPILIVWLCKRCHARVHIELAKSWRS